MTRTSRTSRSTPTARGSPRPGANGAVTVWEIPSGRRLRTLRRAGEPAGRADGSGPRGLRPRRRASGLRRRPRARSRSGRRHGARCPHASALRPPSRPDPTGAVAPRPRVQPRRPPPGGGRPPRDSHLWDVATAARRSRPCTGAWRRSSRWRSAPTAAGSPRPRSGRAAVASAGEIKVWDLATGREVVTFSGAVGGTYALAFTPDGRRLASTGFYHRDVVLWDTSSGRELLALPIDDPRNHRRPGDRQPPGVQPRRHAAGPGRAQRRDDLGRDPAARSPDPARPGLRLGLGLQPRRPPPRHRRQPRRRVDPRRRHRPQSDSPCRCPNASLDTSPDRRAVQPRRPPPGRCRRDRVHRGGSPSGTRRPAGSKGSSTGTPATIINVAFSPDGRRLATASHDRTAKVWDRHDGRELWTLDGHADRVNGVAFSPDGRRWPPACRDGTVKLWDAATGRELIDLRGHRGSIVGVAFSPDGRHLATAEGERSDQAEGPPGEVKVWDVTTGRELFEPPGLTHFRLRRGVQPRRPVPGDGRRGSGRAGLGCRHRPRAGQLCAATTTRSSAWLSARTAGTSPRAARIGRCGSGTSPPGGVSAGVAEGVPGRYAVHLDGLCPGDPTGTHGHQ